LIAGRDFNDLDRDGSEPVVIVSQSLALRMFPHADAVNRHLMWTDLVMKFIDIHTRSGHITGVVAGVDDDHVVPGPAVTVYQLFGQEQTWGGCSCTCTAIPMPSSRFSGSYAEWQRTSRWSGPRHQGHPRGGADTQPLEYGRVRTVRGRAWRLRWWTWRSCWRFR
jgi:hypothetical protein